MRHRRHGRVLGRAPSHRRSLLRNMVSALFLTERETTDLDPNAPKVKGRIITTVAKAKEIRPLVEKCVTLAKRIRVAEQASQEFATSAARNSAEWKSWRESETYRKWVASRGPVVTGRRKLFATLRDKQAVEVLVGIIADRFVDRPVDTLASSSWPRRDWAMQVLERFSSLLARTIASARKLRSQTSAPLSQPPPSSHVERRLLTTKSKTKHRTFKDIKPWPRKRKKKSSSWSAKRLVITTTPSAARPVARS